MMHNQSHQIIFLFCASLILPVSTQMLGMKRSMSQNSEGDTLTVAQEKSCSKLLICLPQLKQHRSKSCP